MIGSNVLRSAVTLLATTLCLPIQRAHAFKFASPAFDGCHEMMTVEAVQRAGWPGGRAPAALSQQERLIAAHLPYHVPGAADDAWQLALTQGVRFNDLHGLEATDLSGLSQLHNDPTTQKEHCLRSTHDDGEAGDISALNACRDFIFERIDAALNDTNPIDMDARTQAIIALSFEGRTEISLNRYAFEVGRALHALQDSFSHTFRSEDGRRVRHVLNFVDWAHGDDAARDGHAHMDALDLCRGTPVRVHRRNVAMQASAELLSALNDATLDHDARRDAAHAVINRWLEREPGCTLDNNWCDAPERLEQATCAVSTMPHGATFWPLGLTLLWLVRRSRRRVLPRARVAWIAWIAPCLVITSFTSVAHAEPPVAAAPTTSTWGIAAMGAVAIDEGALALRLGGRARASSSFEFGLDAEFNPWFSLEAPQLAAGSFNLFGGAAYEWWKEGSITLRTTVHLGVSVLLFDLVGAPAGSWGPLVGINLIGVTINLDPQWKLLLEPGEFMFPVVRLSPFPVYYRQYRFALGLQLTL